MIEIIDENKFPNPNCYAQQFGFGNFMGVSYVYKSITCKGAEPPSGGMTRSVSRRHGDMVFFVRVLHGDILAPFARH